MAVSTDGSAWTTTERVADQVHYEGVTAGYEPRVYSLAVDSVNRILLAVVVNDKQTILFQSTDSGRHFTPSGNVSSRASIGAPLLFATEGGGFVLLLSQGSQADAAAGKGEVTLSYSQSRDGKTWSPLAPFVTDADSILAPRLLPAHAGLKGRDYVVFEAPYSANGAQPTSQIYLKASADSGITWDRARPLTLTSPAFGEQPAGFNNERPRLAALPSELALSWERTKAGDNRSEIWSARLDTGGSVLGEPKKESAGAPSRFSSILRLHGKDYVLYSDGSGQHADGTQGWSIELGERGNPASPQPLANVDRQFDALFPHAVVFHDAPYVFWENSTTKGGGSVAVVRLPPVTSVGAPAVAAVDFSPGQFTNRDSATVRWSEPQPVDAAGIQEYRYSWLYNDGTTTREIETKPVKVSEPRESRIKLDKDGTWTFSITAKDNAGNVTRTPATLSLTRKANPPRPVSFEVLGDGGDVLLEAHFAPPDNRDVHSHELNTNTFTLRWVSAGDTDIVGYTYNIQPGWISLDDYRRSPVPLSLPPNRVVTTSTDVPFANKDNGVYAVTVRAIDRAGNLSPPSTIALALKNYQVVTRVDSVVSFQKDPYWISVTINGRGFVENGTIRKIYLDRGHSHPPWDIELSPASPVTVTDRRISGIQLDQNRDSGSYRVGFLQVRPNGQQAVYWATTPVDVPPRWVPLIPPSLWIAGRSASYVVSFETLVIVLILVMLGTFAFLAIRRIGALALEGAAVNAQVVALLEGRPNLEWQERKKRMQELKKKGMGLRLKFTLLMVVLVTLIVLIVSIPLGLIMVQRQQVSLTDGLQSKANILLGALASGATSQFKQEIQGLAAVKDILSLRTSMTEGTYTTITGRSFEAVDIASANQSPPISGPSEGKDYVWASDQKKYVDEFNAGKFKITQELVADELAKLIPDLQKKIESDALVKLSADIDEYRSLRGQFKNLQARTDAVSKTQAEELRLRLIGKRQDIDAMAQAQYGKVSTTEPLVAGKLRSTYVFYKPVIFYNAAENLADSAFFQGMIRVEVRTDDISKKISEAFGAILGIAGPIALAAIALGILGAIIMASITVTPIRRLARGVAIIRDTEDKEQLKDHSIEVGTRDEIGSLAETVNEMTQGLVKAAIANKELLQGIDVQKRFLPLLKEKAGGAASTAEEENPRLEIFGYYKGAKGVSGDYFDFRRLDDTYYALIKCDVSGKGVSAALIMVEVATLFINYFRDWPKRKDNIAQIKDPQARQRALKELERLEPLVYTINDMVEERGFIGKFAALTVCLYNSATGVVTVCNAGDTQITIYSVGKGTITHGKLPDSPAAGMFPTMLVDMKTPYKQVQQRLENGDVLFLATDGFEDGVHTLRNADFQEMKCDEPGLAVDQEHLGTHKKGESKERFGAVREDDVINAVFNRRKYTLVRNHNALANEELVFDFSTCKGTAKEAVLALVAVEKIYSMVPDPRLGEESKVKMEAKVADFLKEHFLQYQRYFSHHVEGEKTTEYVTFTHAMEDEQYDDLTILVLRRK
ncbi:MAG: SpoIIE family protein phosphatase [Spirochaetia bacterium]